MAPKPVYEIDGNRFSTLEGFYDEISRVLIPGEVVRPHHRNWNSLVKNDIDV